MIRGRSRVRSPMTRRSKRRRSVTRSPSTAPLPPSLYMRKDSNFQRQRFRDRITKVTRIFDKGVISLPANTQNGGGFLPFYLNNIPQFGEITAMFDFYRIDWVTVTFTALSQSTMLYNAVDFNDTAQPTTIDEIISYDSSTVTGPGENFVASFKPMARVTGVQGNNPTAPWGSWWSTSSVDIPHFGLKYIVSKADGVTQGSILPSYRVSVKFYLSVKKVN